MEMQTALSCGDKVWYFSGGRPIQITVGRVCATFTQSAGLDSDVDFCGQILSSDNTAPKEPKMLETYMCIETGIGSGSIHTLGESIFFTEAHCLAGNAAEIERKAQDEQRRKNADMLELLRKEPFLREQIARIDAIKAMEQS